MADPGQAGRRHPTHPHGQPGHAGVAYGPPLVEPEVPVQHMPTTVGTGGAGWRQPPPPPVDHAPRVDETSPSDPAPTTRRRSSRVAVPAPADDASSRARPVSPASPYAASTDDGFDAEPR
ncbi:hypothetical protein NKG94_47610 [Micromonospora sp. M12]